MGHDTIQEIVKLYERYVGMFVTAERRNGKKAAGIFKEITIDGKLRIAGAYVHWIVDPAEITDFSAKPDRYINGGGHNP